MGDGVSHIPQKFSKVSPYLSQCIFILEDWKRYERDGHKFSENLFAKMYFKIFSALRTDLLSLNIDYNSFLSVRQLTESSKLKLDVTGMGVTTGETGEDGPL
jgi:hypothetical protein